jgi:putative tryptophan/tyrosine transport system substrate-binding protein
MKTGLASAWLHALALLALSGSVAETLAQTSLPRVGIISYVGSTDEARRKWLQPFEKKLAELGWMEGKQVAMEFSRAIGDPSQLAAAAAELAGREVDVIFADSAPSTRAAHEATSTIPIVSIDLTTDPIAEGYVESYGRPGKNLTGVFLDAPDFSGKWIELLKAMVPELSRVAVLWDPSPGAAHMNAVRELARSSGIKIQVIEVRTPEDIDRAFSAFRGRPQAVISLPSPMVFPQSQRLARLALKHKLPATSMTRGFADAGGIVSYGPERFQIYERAAVLVARILAGAKPGDLPIERPTKFELIVNLKTAKALGITIPPSILVQADEVIR